MEIASTLTRRADAFLLSFFSLILHQTSNTSLCRLTSITLPIID